MIKTKRLWMLAVASVLVGVNQSRAGENAGAKSSPKSENAAQAILERLKGLQGEWEAAKGNEHVGKGQVMLQIRVTGGGSAVVETIMPGSPMEMLSVYHCDGDQLVMTHYCCVGNQPKMRARPGKDRDEVVFEFAGGTNLDPAKDGHIHSGIIRFIDADHLHSEWDFYVDGKPTEKHGFDLVRKKKTRA